MLTFKEFMDQKESSAFTRSRRNAALGLGPDIPDASINSRSTAPPGEAELLKSKKKKKGDKCKDED